MRSPKRRSRRSRTPAGPPRPRAETRGARPATGRTALLDSFQDFGTAGAGCRGPRPRHPSGQPPPHLSVREERSRARRLLHADALRRPFEFVLALLRAEEVATLLVLAARRAVAALHRHSADRVVRPTLGPSVTRVHVPSPPTSPALRAAGCKVDAARTPAVTRVTVREALPRLGILLHTPGGARTLR